MMRYAEKLRSLFPGISLHPEDLLLLESFQIKYLPERVPVKEFATLIRTYPVVHRFLLAKDLSIRTFLDKILTENSPVENKDVVQAHCREAVWEVADLIIYNKHPEQFDRQAPIKWTISEISSITPLKGKTVADVGAGSGRIAFLLASRVETVYAVEPVSSLRQLMKRKAREKAVTNLYVMDGTLDAIPLPDNSLDILITSNAIGWNLEDELKEIDRVTKAEGCAILLLQNTEKQSVDFHQILLSSPWDYGCREFDHSGNWKRIYHKVCKA